MGLTLDTVRSLWDHQLRALSKQLSLPQDDAQASSFALLFEPGAGKTATAINIWRARCNAQKRFLRTLIFCPPIVVPNWKNEFALNSKVPLEHVHLLTGSGKSRVQKFYRTALHPSLRSGIYVTNYESLLMQDLFGFFKVWQPEAIIFDESHELKNPKAKRSKLAEQLANPSGFRGLGPLPVIPFKQILTGSPVLKDAMDLFQQFLILDGGRTFGTNFFVFQARFFRDRNAGMPKHKYFPNWQIRTLETDGYDAVSEMSRLMERNAMSVRKIDCMDLPPFVQVTIKVPMGETQKRLYAEMKRDFVAYLEDKACVAQLAMVKALRLMQIASGYIKTTDLEEVTLEDAPKIAELTRLLASLTPHSKVLVWAVWRNNYAQIRAACESLKIPYVEVHGDVSETQRNAAVEAINNDPETRVLIGHPGSGGVGINLVAASYSIFYSRTFSLKHSIQAEARNYRGGSEIHCAVTRYDLVSESSIEEIVMEKLLEKIELSENLLKDLSNELKLQEDPCRG